MDLIALEEIRALKHRYLRSIDLKQWDELAETLAEDATTDYGSPSGGRPLAFTGRDEIVSYMREQLGSGMTTVHHCTSPEITIDGDHATGSWCLSDTVLVPRYEVAIIGSAYYEDRYRRVDGAWKIAHTGYNRLYEAKLSFADLPSFRLTADMWASTG